ncbi:ABC transporter substrate-binding protein [Thalassospira sp. NFXS8]|uniref:ABC transporter substrate-binding protein n=1 Tax=Thalassospira sp. NFXS8 TaxID=2819093 RepID=UPI0032DEDD95
MTKTVWQICRMAFTPGRRLKTGLWALAALIAGTVGIAATVMNVASAGDREFPVTADVSGRLVIQSTTDYVIFSPVIDAFQERWPDVLITYNELTTNELNDAMEHACDQGRFLGDLVISSSIDQQLKLVNDGCAQSPGARVGANLPDWAKWRDQLFGLTYEPAVTVYNKAFFANRKPPQNRFDLIDLLRESDTFRAKVGSYDIETSGVGYLFAFQDAIQASTWGRLVESLGRNEAQLFCCTGQILERVADGRLLLGYNVLGSYALSRIGRDDRVGLVLPSDYTLIMSRAAFISRDAEEPALARAFIDFMLSPPGRAILSRDAGLLSPIGGPDRLAQLVGTVKGADPQELRPIALTPALMVGLDQAKRNIFLQQWRAALPPRQLSRHP